MRYPGDQDNSGDRFGEPTAPYGPGADPYGPEQTDDGRPGRNSPFPPSTPPPGAFAGRPGESFRPFDGGFDDRPHAPGGLDATQHLPPSTHPPGRHAAAPGDAHRRRPHLGPSSGSGPRYGSEREPTPFAQGHPGPEAFDPPAGPPHEPAPPAHQAPPESDTDHDTNKDTDKTTKRPHTFLVATGAVVVGLALAGSGFTVSRMLTSDDGEPAAAAAPTQPATALPTPTPTPAPLKVKFKNRASDPTPLTLAEVFGTRTFKRAGVVYTRTAWKHDRDCAKGVIGAEFEAVLKKGGCTQVLRASYARRDGSLIGTVGVLNLRTEAAAQKAAKAAAGRDIYLQPLPAKTGVSRTLGKGTALGTAYSRGHYLIMTWVQRPDGKEIATRDHQKVNTFQQQVILGSNLYRALHYRGIAGKPLTSR